ncbi:MAG: sulfatase-like hydrolase/transferase [Planctomycetes bacterium]|nr:sulfatase-like hydrolase/transferase [Planctomycetota bacterium]
MRRPSPVVRPIALAVAYSLVLSAGAVLAAENTPAKEPLNFVILLVDDLGWADLGCYGSDLHETPNIDRFAQESVRFTQAYAASPVCSPTRASIMTGKYPARLHVTVWYESSANPPQNRKLVPPITVGNLPHSEVTLANVLHEAGYLTAHVGKWHLGDAAHYPQTQGFDVNIGGTFWGAPTTFFYPYSGSGTFGKEFRYVPHLEFGDPDEYLTDRLTDEALDVLQRSAGKPFFLNMCWHTVHTPIEAKKEVVDRYAKKLCPKTHHQNATYAAMVESLDENVGRILEKLDELKIADRTVVLLTSDNGGFINRHRGQAVTNNHPLRSGKGSLWEGGVRVPLMIRWPGVTRGGTTCTEPVVSTDFYPTILEMAALEGNADHNADVDGVSLVPLLEDPQAKLDRDAIYFHYPHYYRTTTPVSSVRAGDWKLLEFHEEMHVELYNLREDPSETRDLADQIPDRADDLRRRLHAWREKVDAQMPEPNPAQRKSGSRPKTTPVTGVLMLDGFPVAGATVTFSPMPAGASRGHAAYGVTDAVGRFKLATFVPVDGAAPGRYMVAVALEARDERGEVTSLVPKRYADPRTSELTVQVAAGDNRFDFHLVSR